MKKTAMLIGATGLTGSYLLDLLIKSEQYEKVVCLVRRETGRKDSKLEEIVCDFNDLDKYKSSFIADDIFCCIGTTKSKTPDEEVYRSIDYGIPCKLAQLAEQRATTFCIISALGADPDSKIFYSRTKGEMERDILKTNIPNIIILRPSIIVGQRKDKRIFEKTASLLLNVTNFIAFNKLKKYKSISGEELAQIMLSATNKLKGHRIIERNMFENI